MSEENRIEYPCTECETEEKVCNRQRKYLKCEAWREWFRQQWERIQKIFARDVSNRHEQKGGDDK